MKILNNDNPKSNGEEVFFQAIKWYCNTIFDVGSRFDSLFANDNSLEVHYFEPVSEYLDKLIATENNPRSKFNNFGLGNINGMISYYHQFQSFVDRT